MKFLQRSTFLFVNVICICTHFTNLSQFWFSGNTEVYFYFYSHQRTWLLIFFLGRGEGWEKEERITYPCLLHAPQLGTKPTTQACALIRHQTRDLSVHRNFLQPTEPRQPGSKCVFNKSGSTLPGHFMQVPLTKPLFHEFIYINYLCY